MYASMHVSYDFPSHLPLLLETVLACVVWSYLLYRLTRREKSTAPQTGASSPLLARILARRRLAYAVLGVGAACLVLITHLLLGPPVPYVHDEFSYLLGADTWVEGRLTNPAPPSPAHFEQPQVLVEPTRASKYPVGQSAILAAAKALTSRAWPALPFSSALLAMTAFWMFRSWLPDSWAFGGAAFVAAGLGLGHWAQSYWGGSLAAIGGGLLFGAVLRLVGPGRPRTFDEAALAVGLAVLAVTRPFEGAWIALPAVGFLVWSLLRGGRTSSLVRVGLVVGVVLAPLFAFQITLNRAVTKNAMQMPYQLHHDQYQRRPLFLWQEASNEKTRRNRPIEALHGRYDDPRPGEHRARVFLETLAGRTPRVLLFFLGVSLLPGFLASFRTLGDSRTGLGLSCVAWGIVGSSVTWSWWPHYTAPIALLTVAMALEGIRSLGLSPTVMTLLILPRILATTAELPAFRPDPGDWVTIREDLAQQLRDQPGKDLVFVPQTVLANSTWTANPARLESAEVLWVWDRGPDENRDLTRSLPERRVWFLELDPARLTNR